MSDRTNEECRYVNCDYCGEPAELVTGEKIYPHRRDLYRLRFWSCDPCNAYVGTHKNSGTFAPLGRLANAELRKAKKQAHSHFDPIWKNGELSRTKAYRKLAEKLGIPVKKCHIGYFDVAMCAKVVEVSTTL